MSTVDPKKDYLLALKGIYSTAWPACLYSLYYVSIFTSTQWCGWLDLLWSIRRSSPPSPKICQARCLRKSLKRILQPSGARRRWPPASSCFCRRVSATYIWAKHFPATFVCTIVRRIRCRMSLLRYFFGIGKIYCIYFNAYGILLGWSPSGQIENKSSNSCE